MQPQNEKQSDTYIDLPDITIDEVDDFTWADWLGLGLDMIFSIGFPLLGHIRAAHGLNKDINALKVNIDAEIKQGESRIKQMNDDIAELGNVYIRADQYNRALDTMPENTTRQKQQVKDWVTDNWMTFSKKWHINEADIKSNIKALQGETGQGLPLILRQEIKDFKYITEKIGERVKELSNMIKDIKAEDIPDHLFPELRGILDEIENIRIPENMIQAMITPMINEIKGTTPIIEGEIMDIYKNILKTKNEGIKHLKDIIGKYGFNMTEFDDIFKEIEELVNSPDLLYNTKDGRYRFNKVMEKYRNQLKGVNVQLDSIDDLNNLGNEFNALKKQIKEDFDMSFNNFIYSKLQPLFQDMLNRTRYIIKNMPYSDLIKVFPESHEVINKVTDIIKNPKKYFMDYVNEQKGKYRDTINKIKQNAWEVMKENINAPHTLRVIEQILPRAKVVIDSIVDLNNGGFQALKEQIPNIENMTLEQLRQLPGNELLDEFIKFKESPVSAIQDKRIENIKRKQIERYNNGEQFYQLQLPESYKYNFDFVNSTKEEKDEYKKIYLEKKLWKSFGDKKINVSDMIRSGKEIDSIWERAQELKTNPKTIMEYEQMLQEGVDPLFRPFLIAAQVPDFNGFIKYIKDFDGLPFEREIMLYNLQGNNPELYIKYTKTRDNQILQDMKSMTKDFTMELMNEGPVLLEQIRDKKFDKVVEGLKNKAAEKAKYYIMTAPFDPQQAELTLKYANEPVYNYSLDGNIFQDKVHKEQLRQQNEVINKLRKDQNYLIDIIKNGNRNQVFAIDMDKVRDYVPDDIKNDYIQQNIWNKQRYYALDYDQIHRMIQSIQGEIDQIMSEIGKPMNKERYLMQRTGKVSEDVKRFDPETNDLTFYIRKNDIDKDTKAIIEEIKNNQNLTEEQKQQQIQQAKESKYRIIPQNDIIDKALEELMNEYLTILRQTESEEIPGIVQEFKRKRAEIMTQAIKQHEFTTGVKLQGKVQPQTFLDLNATNEKGKQYATMKKYQLDRVMNNYLDKYKKNETENRNVINKYTRGVKTKQAKIQALKDYNNKLWQNNISDENIDKINTLYSDLVNAERKTDKNQVPDLIPRRQKGETNVDEQGKMIWHDWAYNNFPDVADKFEYSAIRQNPLYEGFNDSIEIKQGKAGDNWMQDQIKKFKDYDYSKTLKDNFNELNNEQKMKILSQGLPNDLDDKLINYVTYRNIKKNYRNLPKEIIMEIIKRQEK